MPGDHPAAVRQLLRGAQLLTLRLLAEFNHDAFMSGVSEAVGGPGPGPPLVMTVVPRQLGAQLRQLATRLWPGGLLAKLGGAAAAAALLWWWYSADSVYVDKLGDTEIVVFRVGDKESRVSILMGSMSLKVGKLKFAYHMI